MWRLLLALAFSSAVQAQDQITKPEYLRFGASLVEVQSALTSKCAALNTRSISPITAPLAKESQVQIDCEGFRYGGAERKMELVFQDDQLDIIWILLAEEELPLFKQEFTQAYGEPSFEIDFGTVFLQANAAVRIQPPEVLFASARQVEAMLQQLASDD